MLSIDILSARQRRHERLIETARQIVPQGPYCYTLADVAYPDGIGKPPRIKHAACPFYRKRTDWPEQADGYCRFLKAGDSTKGRDRNGNPRSTMLLWDQVKECGVNDDLELET